MMRYLAFQVILAFIIPAAAQSLPKPVVGAITAGSVTIGVKGAACDGTTDDTTAINAALAARSAAGGGVLTGVTHCLISSGNLVIPYNVQLKCGESGGGFQPNGNYGAVANIILNPAYTISLSATAGGRAGVFGCLIVRQGISSPTTLRGFITEAKNFAGTAITCTGGGLDVDIERNAILGFALGIYSNCSRIHTRFNKLDDTAGIYLDAVGDYASSQEDEVWQFLASPNVSPGPQYQITTVTGAANNGSGLIRLAFTAPATAFVTGDIVVVGSVGGVPNASGRWTVTYVDSTHIDLQASTWGGTFTSGGGILLNGMLRTGAAMEAHDASGSPLIFGFLEYGWDTGLHYSGASSGVSCVGCWLDGLGAAYDPVAVNLLMDGTAGINHYQGFILGPGTEVVVNSNADPAGGNPAKLFLTDTQVITSTAAGAGQYGIKVLKGSLYWSNGHEEVCCGNSTPTTYIADAATEVFESNVTHQYITANPPVVFQTPATDCPKFRQDGVIGPCAWTPVASGSTLAGTETPVSGYPAGWYTASNGQVTVSARISDTSLVGATGSLVIGPLPVVPTYPNANQIDSCAVGRATGITLGGGYSWLAVTVGPPGGGVFVLVELSGAGTQVLNAASFTSAFELAFTCTYHR